MDRYTEWIDGHGSGLPGKDCYTRLAEYEDLEKKCIEENGICIELMLKKFKEFKTEMHELLEYKQLEEQGKLMKFPCKLGDKIFWISDEDEEGNEVPMVREGNKIIGIGIQKDGLYVLEEGDYEYRKVGKRYAFLSKENAEESLSVKE